MKVCKYIVHPDKFRFVESSFAKNVALCAGACYAEVVTICFNDWRLMADASAFYAVLNLLPAPSVRRC